MTQVRPDASVAILTPDQRVRVFVSSAMKELAEERAAAARAIGALRLLPVMFEHGARPHAPRDLYRSYLDQSHIFVGIYGESYGWVAPGMAISGLEDELQLAADKPRLIYVKRATSERDPRLVAMMDRIREQGGLSYRSFGTPAELEQLLMDDLALLLSERFERQLADHRIPRTPITVSAFIGRGAEMEEILRSLRDTRVRLVTLCGPGGVGKTRLALEASRAAIDDFPDGAVVVWLDRITEPSLLLEAVAAELGVRPRSDRPLMSTIADRLAGKRMLVILDNLEHVMAAVNDVSDLISLSTGGKFLVTSREVLRVRGERVLTIDPLAVPAAHETGADGILSSDAVAFFVDRARAASPSFQLDEDDAVATREIVCRLEGLPLALELAAARTTLLPPKALLARLDSALDVPAGDLRDLPSRQRTIRDTIAWSYGLLEEREQRVLEDLSVFSTSVSLEAAERVLKDVATDSFDVLAIVSSLMDKSLLTRRDRQGEPRFGMLAAIRGFAVERLARSGREERTRDRHARFFAELAAEVAPRIHSPDQVACLELLERDHPNLQAALEWLLSQHRTRDVALLCNSLRWFWLLRGHAGVGAYWLRRLLSAAEVSDDVPHSALVTAGMMSLSLGRLDEARSLLEDALVSANGATDADEIAWARTTLGEVFQEQGDAATAERQQQLALSYFTQVGDLLGECSANTRLSALALAAGDPDLAEERLSRSLAVRREIRDPWGTGYVLTGLGELRLIDADVEGAEMYLQEALRLNEEVGYLDGIARVNDLFGFAAAAHRDWARAADSFGAAVAIYRDAGNRFGLSIALAHLGQAELELERIDAGVRRALEAVEIAQEVKHPRAVSAAYDALGAASGAAGLHEHAASSFDAAATIRSRSHLLTFSRDPLHQGQYGRGGRKHPPDRADEVDQGALRNAISALRTWRDD